MSNAQKSCQRCGWLSAAFLVWFIMNIRVAIGVGTTLERAVDGLVGMALLLASVYAALDFFKVIGREGVKGGP